MELTIDCQARPSGSKTKALRREGRIPAVLYGHQGTESLELTVDNREAQKLLRKASLNNTLIKLNVADSSWSGKTLLREVQTHPWKGNLYHLSFFAVGADSMVDATVPVHFVGDAPGVKVGGGSLDVEMTEMTVRCNANSIPESIEVSVAELQVGDTLRVADIALPAGVAALDGDDQVVVAVQAGSGSSTEEE